MASGDPSTFHGPTRKYAVLAGGLERLQHSVDLRLSSEGGVKGAWSAAQAVRKFRGDLIIVRAGPALVAAWPWLLRHRMRGTLITIESPSPASSGLSEALAARGRLPRRIAHIALILVSAPWLKLVAHRVVMFGHEEWAYFRMFLGERTVLTTNSVDVDELQLAQEQPSDGPVRLIMVATVSRWHGVDRLIDGIDEDGAGGRDIEVIVVGDGPEVKSLRERARSRRLMNVQFHPNAIGDELDRHFDSVDVAVGSLGLHRIGLRVASPLKNREYLARGLPVVYAGTDPDLDEAKRRGFALRMESSESPLSMEQIRDWALRNRSRKRLRREIREFARGRVGPERLARAYVPLSESARPADQYSPANGGAGWRPAIVDDEAGQTLAGRVGSEQRWSG